MKSLELTLSVLNECGQLLGIDTTRDRKTITDRVLKEGDGFLTITLPRLEKELLAWLDFKIGTSDLFFGFRRSRGGLPAFMQGFLRILLDTPSGSSPSVTAPTPRQGRALWALRQVLTLQGKKEEVCAPWRVYDAIQGYIATDAALREHRGTHEAVRVEFARAFGPAIRRVEAELFSQSFVGRHGPGAVSDRTSPNQRWSVAEWPHNLQRVVPFWEVIPTTQIIDGASPEVVSRPRSRLSAVPKTAKAPRLIGIEPWQHQFVQQGLLRLLTQELQHEPVWRYMGWNDQERNRTLAREASENRGLSTIDLSEASDRVSVRLVNDLLAPFPYFRDWVMACRSTHVEIPELGPLELAKFASMGSALTFPIECMVFYAIASAGIRETGGSSRPSVYGDDIIVPTHALHNVFSLLEYHSFKVNHTKSFWTGWFRESCGSDWFGGIPVNTVKVRYPIEDTRSATGLEKAIGLRNRLFEAGLWQTVDLIDSELAYVPFGPVGSPHLSRWTYDQSKIEYRRNKDLNVLEHRCLVIERRLPVDELHGYGALNKCLTMGEQTLLPLSVDHLTRSGRPLPGRAKARWGTVL